MFFPEHLLRTKVLNLRPWNVILHMFTRTGVQPNDRFSSYDYVVRIMRNGFLRLWQIPYMVRSTVPHPAVYKSWLAVHTRTISIIIKSVQPNDRLSSYDYVVRIMRNGFPRLWQIPYMVRSTVPHPAVYKSWLAVHTRTISIIIKKGSLPETLYYT